MCSCVLKYLSGRKFFPHAFKYFQPRIVKTALVKTALIKTALVKSALREGLLDPLR